MVLKVLGFIGLNYLLSFLITTLLFVSIILMYNFKKVSHRVFFSIIILLLDMFILYSSYKWFGFFALILPIFMFLFSILSFLAHIKEDDTLESNYD